MLLTWGLIRWTAKVLPCSHSDAVVLAAAQVGGLFIRSVADWSFRWVISRGSKDGSDACGKSVSIFTRLPSRGVPGFVPTPSVLARIGPGTMSAWPRPAVVARAVPIGVGKVKPRLV